MSSIRIVNVDELRATVRFDDLIEPMARAFQESSAGLADNGLIVLFPASDPCAGYLVHPYGKRYFENRCSK